MHVPCAAMPLLSPLPRPIPSLHFPLIIPIRGVSALPDLRLRPLSDVLLPRDHRKVGGEADHRVPRRRPADRTVTDWPFHCQRNHDFAMLPSARPAPGTGEPRERTFPLPGFTVPVGTRRHRTVPVQADVTPATPRPRRPGRPDRRATGSAATLRHRCRTARPAHRSQWTPAARAAGCTADPSGP